jgi:hypothetical protein
MVSHWIKCQARELVRKMCARSKERCGETPTGSPAADEQGLWQSLRVEPLALHAIEKSTVREKNMWSEAPWSQHATFRRRQYTGRLSRGNSP